MDFLYRFSVHRGTPVLGYSCDVEVQPREEMVNSIYKLFFTK